MDVSEESKANRKSFQNIAKTWLLKNKLLLFTLLGVLSGLVLGFGLRSKKLHPDAILVISYPGELFMRLLKLLILPLIISSLIAGTSGLSAKINGRIAVRTFTYFLLTSSFNAAFGIFLALVIHPGRVGHTENQPNIPPMNSISILDSMLDLGRNIVPDNLIQATFQQTYTAYVRDTSVRQFEDEEEPPIVRTLQYRTGVNTLGLVVFSILFGITVANTGARGRIVADLFSAIFDVTMNLIGNSVVVLTPIGVASIIAGKVLSVNNLGLVLTQMAWFVFTVILGVLIYQFIILQGIYFVVLRKNPYNFYYQLLNPMLTAFACASTAAALPVTFNVMETKLKIDSRVTKFILPIGANINTDGTALFVSIATIFIAQINSISLGLGDILTVFFLSIAASSSVSSVPSAALIGILMVLSAIQVPAQDVTLLFAIDWLLDRFRTTNNMLSDCYGTAIVAHLSSKELNSNTKDTVATQVKEEQV